MKVSMNVMNKNSAEDGCRSECFSGRHPGGVGDGVGLWTVSGLSPRGGLVV